MPGCRKCVCAITKKFYTGKILLAEVLTFSLAYFSLLLFFQNKNPHNCGIKLEWNRTILCFTAFMFSVRIFWPNFLTVAQLLEVPELDPKALDFLLSMFIYFCLHWYVWYKYRDYKYICKHDNHYGDYSSRSRLENHGVSQASHQYCSFISSPSPSGTAKSTNDSLFSTLPPRTA